ncbi:TPA: hypothetical protein LZ439_001697 [Escherichia coli]|uniref:hypothetical protein n=1 Tax=Escherichia coli TaxID=562 RepID=UPI0016591A7F|nr:hypothetical protein [Escherichia coli]MBC9527292.1 hypothetical protein [Escherichia coli]HBC3315465.1 hypothetical protein [Escherichia coli]HBM7750505.1 hypothetical protein [Escherichia coli]HCL5823555.1 hypothetical protein [Escherichia coli]
MVSKYAVLKECVVENIIVADDNYSPDDFEVVKNSDETFCQPGMLYNKEDGLFYDDK